LPGTLTPAYDPSTWEVVFEEQREFRGQTGLQNESLSQNKNNKQNKKARQTTQMLLEK
jgi:hypothetical protein